MEEVRVGQTVEPEIQTLPDEEMRGVKIELRSLLTSASPSEIGTSVMDYVRGFEAWQNSQFRGSETPVELVLEPMFLETGDGTVSLNEVNILLRSRGGIGPDEFKKYFDGIHNGAQQIIETRNTSRVVPTLKVEV